MMLQQGIDPALGSLSHGVWAWLSPKASAIGDFGDFIFFKFVLERLQHDIRVFGEAILGNVMAFVTAVALVVLTLWVLIQGYRLITGQLRESAMALVTNALKAVFIVAIALSFNAGNNTLTKYLTEDMQSGIHELITGKNALPADEIDTNLGWMQVAMSSMDALDAGGDLGGNLEKERAQTWIGFGTGGPAITAGALLLMYQVAMALFIGLGPLFILCLLFDFTKSLFQKWLFYGIGTMFSMAVLSAMVSIALAMVTDVAKAMWASDVINTLILQDGGATGYSSRALQSGSMGMILTLLLITVPPMAANFFSGTLGNFMHFSAFGAGGAPGPQGQPPGSFGGGGGYNPQAYQPAQAPTRNDVGGVNADRTPGNLGAARTNMHAASNTTGTGSGADPNAIKQNSMLRDQQSGDPNAGRVFGNEGSTSGQHAQPNMPPQKDRG